MSKEEQEEIKKGLKQADKGEYIANETVMKRFEMALKIVWTPQAERGLDKPLNI